MLGHFLIWGDHSRLPSGVHFKKNLTKYNCVVFFGDDDWLQVEPVRELIEQLPENHKCEGIHLIKDCDHKMSFDNEKNTNEQIFKFYELFKKKMHKINHNFGVHNLTKSLSCNYYVGHVDHQFHNGYIMQYI